MFRELVRGRVAGELNDAGERRRFGEMNDGGERQRSADYLNSEIKHLIRSKFDNFFSINYSSYF